MILSRPKHIFFDLDHTLWDFEENARETLAELLEEYGHKMNLAPDPYSFYKTYSGINERLWKLFRENHIDSFRLRYIRFREAFQRFDIKWHGWVDQFGNDYLDRCPQKSHLIPGAREMLNTLHGKVPLHIITNGFFEVQKTKMTASGLNHFFEVVVDSDSAGAKKPDKKIFEFALHAAGASAQDSIYIGDNYEADIVGAIRAGFSVIFFNPGQLPNPLGVQEVKNLLDIPGILGF